MPLPSSAALYNGRHCVGRRRNVGVRTCAVWPLPKVTLKSPSPIGTAERSHRLCDHLEQARWQRGERRGQLRAAVGRGVCWRTPLAREHHGNEHLEPLHTSASESITASATPCACARLGVHMQPGLSAWRLVRGLDSIIAQCSPLRGYSTHTQRCGALVRQRLGGVGGGAPAHARRRRTPAQQSTKRPWQRWLRAQMWVGVSPVLAQMWAA